MVKLQRTRGHERRGIRQPTDRSVACPAVRDRARENALRAARTNLIAPSRDRKDADHKSGGPRYPLPLRFLKPLTMHGQLAYIQ
jgi:hypothetical protein